MVVEVKVGKLDIFRNEESYNTTKSVLTILPDEVIPRRCLGFDFLKRLVSWRQVIGMLREDIRQWSSY